MENKRHKKIYQADCYQCGVWVYLAVRGFLEFLEQEQIEEFKLESFEEIVILENTSDKRNDHFISLTREQMKEELEFACSKDELSFKSPQSEEIENIELIDHVIFVSQPDDNNDDAEEQQEDYLVHDKH